MVDGGRISISNLSRETLCVQIQIGNTCMNSQNVLYLKTQIMDISSGIVGTN